MSKKIRAKQFKEDLKNWDLTNPIEARKFIKALRFNNGTPEGSPITFFTDANGINLSIEEASDEQILQVASQFVEKN